MEFAAELGGLGQPAAPAIAEVLNVESPLLQRLPVKKVSGLVEKYGELTFYGGVGTRSINSPFPDSDSSKVNPKEERLMLAGAKAKVDVRLARINEGVARGNEIARRTKVIGAYITDQVLHGQGKTDQEKLVGIDTRATGAQLITAATNGTTMTLDLFHSLIDAVIDQGAGRFSLMNITTWRALKKSIITAAGGATVQEVAQGIFRYEGVDIVIARQDHEGNELLAFDETCGSSNATASVYCFAPGTAIDETGVQLLMASNSIEVIPEGIRDSQVIDTVEVAVGFAIYHPRSMARLKGIKAA
jgi:hypothetical protein